MADADLIARGCGPLVGLTVREVIAALSLPPAECRVFEEPPAVGRGLEWFGPDGLRVAVWVARQAGIFRLPSRWDVAEILPLRAVGVEVRQLGHPGRGGEWWAGGGRFSRPSQLTEAEPGAAADGGA